MREVGRRLSGYRLMRKVCMYRVPGLFAPLTIDSVSLSCAIDSSPDGGMEGKCTITVNYLFHPFILVTMNPSLTSSYCDGSSITVAALIGWAVGYGYDSMLLIGQFAWARTMCNG